jgi:leucine dehydrogenase
MSEGASWEHDEVVTRLGRRSGLPITVAIHSRALGPAAGGIRLRHYADWRDGLTDALRLSKGMTYKNAVAGLPFGGGKSVIAAPAGEFSRADVLADLGELIESFGGTYLGGPDVGTGPDDMVALRSWTQHVFCLPESHGGTGSSSGPTAAGVLAALRAGARTVFGTSDVRGRRVVVIGLGSVGTLIAETLAKQGASVVATDVDLTKRALGFEWVDPAEALSTPADVLIPAAVGGVFTEETVVHAPLVVGPANNQLTTDTVAETLAAQGVVWVPDFVASGGGVIYTLTREAEGLDHTRAMAKVTAIEDTVEAILSAATTNATTPLTEATTLAKRKLGHLAPTP